MNFSYQSFILMIFLVAMLGMISTQDVSSKPAPATVNIATGI